MISSSLPHRPISSRRLDRCVLLVLFVLLVSDVLSGLLPASFTSTTSRTGRPLGFVPVASAWEWTDYVVGGKGSDDDEADQRKTLTHAEISGLRVRDIKRRLARSHGYGANELARMLDKKDLIAALSKEESKVKNKYQSKKRRKLLWKGLFVALMCVVTIVGWPLWVQATEVMAVNWQVYYDRKKHEISQCIEFHSFKGAIGVLLLSVLDGFRFWLSATVLLSWVLSSDSYYRRYMFPIPSLSIRPGQFMGEKVANGPLGRYGMNIAPMAITWSMGFVRGKIEYWTGKALSKAAKRRRKQARSGETEEEKKARKAARKAAKRAAAEEKEKSQQETWQKEMERRKEMAQKASEHLYGGVNSNRNVEQQHEESEEQNESRIPDNDYDDAKREFEADMEEMEDINDLD